MTATVSKAGPYYASGEIKFSSLRTNFRAQVRKETSSGSETFNSDTAEIKASELLKNTIISNTNPVVPDATENANISSEYNWKTSQFRGSIKYFYITQSDTEINFDIDAQSWNSNLNKNVRKFLFVDGTCGSNVFSSPAAQLSATASNLTIDTYGSILGASGRGGGTGGGAPAISGQSGGDALEILSGGFGNLNATQSYTTISGVDSNLLSLDIYYNSNTSISKPVVIYIHGGGFALGDKSAVHSKATFFNNLGYVFASINYRLSPAANLLLPYNLFVGGNGTLSTASTRVKHTNHVTDCANAITWVYNNISSYGGDANKLVLMGHSAGAVLASLLVTNQSYLTTAGLPSGKILGCISNDTESYNVLQQILDPISDGDTVDQQKMAMNAFGIYPDKTVTGTINNITTDFATTAAAAASYATGSAILNISASTPPFLVLRRGANERIARETEFVTALQNAGRPVTAVSYPGDTTYTHMEINESIGATFDPPSGKTLPAGVSNVTSQIQNWITSIAPAPASAVSAAAVSGNNIVVRVRAGSKIYAGGGGGEKGKTGNNGSNGTCTIVSTVDQCKNCPNCPSGWTVTRDCYDGWHCDRQMKWGCWGDQWWETAGNTKYKDCRFDYAVSGGLGGIGGNGGPGRGYNNQSGSLTGAGGDNGGSGGTCVSGGSYTLAPGIGDIGETGAPGGEWGTNGGNTNNTGSGGISGRSIFGSNYSIDPNSVINSDTIKGVYN